MSVQVEEQRVTATLRIMVREMRTAVGHFLRGFVGVGSTPARGDHEHGVATAASAREALSSQAARRGRCC